MTDSFEKSPEEIELAIQQFVDAQLRGEMPDIDDIAGQFPGQENVIRKRIQNLKDIDNLFNVLLKPNMDTPAEHDLIGQKLGDFKILKKIGQGGMGSVYKASDTRLYNREVALKLLPTFFSDHEYAIEKMRKEAYLAIKLDHPNIVRIYEFGNINNHYFISMEYISGVTLENKISSSSTGTLSLKETINIVEGIASALYYAHSLPTPVIHRDLKPANIMVAENGAVKVLDFGIAGEMKGICTRITKTPEISGTLPYMSPEQLRGERSHPSMDIYSLGITAYECLAGKPPFWTGAIDYQILNEKPEDIEGVPGSIMLTLQRALSKHPQNRPSTAKDFMDLLKSVSVEKINYISIPLPVNTTLEEYANAKYEYIYSNLFEYDMKCIEEAIGEDYFFTHSRDNYLEHLRSIFLQTIKEVFSFSECHDRYLKIQKRFLKSKNYMEYEDTMIKYQNSSYAYPTLEKVEAMSKVFIDLTCPGSFGKDKAFILLLNQLKSFQKVLYNDLKVLLVN